MSYTASSVKQELDKLSNLTINGGLQCPQNAAWQGAGNTPCPGALASCGVWQDKKCKQRIHIHTSNGSKLTILTFYFTISSTNHDGFIDEHDQQLNLLLRNQPMINTQKFDLC